LNRLDLRGVDDLAGALPRPVGDPEEPLAAVRSILARVREEGDAALIELTERFDGVRLDPVRVPPEQLQAALDSQPAELRAALELARDRIAAHHRAQLGDEVVHDEDGIHIRSYRRPVDRAGC
jgi:histidinol dehydrogenase